MLLLLLGLRFFLALINLICRHELNMCDFFLTIGLPVLFNNTNHIFMNLHFSFFSDRWSVSGSSNSEYHYLSNVYGEGLIRTLYDVQCCRTEHSWHSRGKVCSDSGHLTLKLFVLIFHEIQVLVSHVSIMGGLYVFAWVKRSNSYHVFNWKICSFSFHRNYS